jgi:hypothetical protein
MLLPLQRGGNVDLTDSFRLSTKFFRQLKSVSACARAAARGSARNHRPRVALFC